MGFISSKNKSAISAGSGGGYLNPSKIQSGGSVRFALLQDQPLEFFECWGESSDGGVKPFRFSDDPSPEDIQEEMGPEFSRRLNREGTAPEKVKFAIAVPVYNYEASSVQIMQLSQKSLQNELDDIFVIKSGLEVNDKIVLDGVRQVRDGEKVECEFCKPEEALANQKHHAE